MSAEQVKVYVYNETTNQFSWLPSFSHLLLSDFFPCNIQVSGILSDINSAEKKNDFLFVIVPNTMHAVHVR